MTFLTVRNSPKIPRGAAEGEHLFIKMADQVLRELEAAAQVILVSFFSQNYPLVRRMIVRKNRENFSVSLGAVKSIA